MKNITRNVSLFALISAMCLLSTPAWSVNKEMVQLQASVDDLKAQMTQMSQSFNERMGVMKNLIDQNTDTMNKVGAAINNLQGLIQKQQGDSASHGDQLSGQIQALNDSIDELKARLGKVSKQLEDLQSAQQSIAAQQAQQAQQARRLRRTCSTTVRCGTSTRPRTTWLCRNLRITSSTIPTPI